MPDSVFKKVLTPALYERYQFFMYKSYVEISKAATWCTGKNCDMVVELKDTGFTTFDVTCSGCLDCFCFDCGKPGHQPVSCEMIKVWESRLGSSDDDTDKWMKLNTKSCPTCNAVVQKNGGCMYIMCS